MVFLVKIRENFKKLSNNRKYFSVLLRIPSLAVLIGLFLIPIIYMFNISFRNLSFALPHATGQWIALENYQTIWASKEFWHSMKITLLFVAVTVPSELIIGLGIALLLNRNIKWRRLFTSFITIPMLIAPIVVGLMWIFMLNADVGIVPYYLELFGLHFENILGETKTAFPAIMAIEVWHWTPLLSLMLLAGLQAIPAEPYEAAIVDGASRPQIFKYITLPLLRPVIIIALILRGIDVFKIFDEVFILTGGGPGNTTEVINMLAYKVNFIFWNMGYGATIGAAIFLTAFFGTSFLFLLMRER